MNVMKKIEALLVMAAVFAVFVGGHALATPEQEEGVVAEATDAVVDGDIMVVDESMVDESTEADNFTSPVPVDEGFNEEWPQWTGEAEVAAHEEEDDAMMSALYATAVKLFVQKPFERSQALLFSSSVKDTVIDLQDPEGDLGLQCQLSMWPGKTENWGPWTKNNQYAVDLIETLTEITDTPSYIAFAPFEDGIIVFSAVKEDTLSLLCKLVK